MDHLVRTLFVTDSRMTRREIRKFGILQIAPDDALGRKVAIIQSESRLEHLFPIRETMTRNADPLILAKLFNEPRSARFTPYMRVNVPLRAKDNGLIGVLHWHCLEPVVARRDNLEGCLDIGY